MSEIGDRIKQARKRLGLTQPQLAEKCGWATQSRVSNYERGDREPKSSDIKALAKALQVTPAWLWTGDGPEITTPNEDSGPRGPRVDAEKLRIPDAPSSAKGGHPRSELQWAGTMEAWDDGTELESDEVEVPLFREVELAAGAGRTQVVENHGAKLRFARSTLRRAGVQPENAGCAYVAGNSMSGLIPDGATIGVDKGITEVHDGDIYAIDHEGMLRVKYLYRIPGGGLKLRSENETEHPPEEYSADQVADSIRVIGRVFWWAVLR